MHYIMALYPRPLACSRPEVSLFQFPPNESTHPFQLVLTSATHVASAPLLAGIQGILALSPTSPQKNE